MSQAVHEAWRLGNLEKAEDLLSKEIANPDCSELVTYSLANRALIRARLRNWDQALEDARMVMCTSSLHDDSDLTELVTVSRMVPMRR